MHKLLMPALFVSQILYSQSVPPGILGAWKADLTVSKFAGPPVSKYLEITEEGEFRTEAPSDGYVHGIKELIGSWSEEGGRELLTFSMAKPVIVPYAGVIARITASAPHDQLEVRAVVPGGPIAEHRRYELSRDGRTLTIQSDQAGFGPVEHSTIVLRRQDPIQTEELKKLPASEVMDRMHYFSWSLNKRCSFCHVMPFKSDTKDQKRTARQMIVATAAMNRSMFQNAPMDCFTCHQFSSHPATRPPFADEPGDGGGTRGLASRFT